MLNRGNILSKGRCKKLVDRMYGPFEIVLVGYNHWYCKLDLPSSWKIHATFNVSLLKGDSGTNANEPRIEIEADNGEWTRECIITSRQSSEDSKKHLFLVKW